MARLKNTIWVVLGTRPEAIKQAPVFLELCRLAGRENVSLVGTGQHEELLNGALKPFGIALDMNLKVMGRGGDLCGVSALILEEMGAYMQEYQPRCLIVQGDTSTAAMSGLAAFFNRIPVFHNEAGLRSYDNYNPFPEEVNRKILTGIADVHLAPTLLAKEVLIKEGVPANNVFLTGNTGIDALWTVLRRMPSDATQALLDKIRAKGRRPVLMTAHRRENAGQGMEDWMECVKNYFLKHPELALVFPLHPNNLAREAASEKLGNLSNCYLIDPLDYIDCCHVLSECSFVVTDSGGIQEEAATLGIPVVVCRKTTERMEAVHAGIAKLAGLQLESILEAMEWASRKACSEERRLNKIFGDGDAARQIAEIVLARVTLPETQVTLPVAVGLQGVDTRNNILPVTPLIGVNHV